MRSKILSSAGMKVSGLLAEDARETVREINASIFTEKREEGANDYYYLFIHTFL